MVGYSYDYLYVSVTVIDPSLYEKLMNDKRTGMDTESIKAYYIRKMILVSHGGISVDIRYSLSCPTPEEDLQTLRMIGKVKWEPGYSTPSRETISCASRVGVPF